MVGAGSLRKKRERCRVGFHAKALEGLFHPAGGEPGELGPPVIDDGLGHGADDTTC